MEYAIKLADDGRILSATYLEYAAAGDVIVDALPEGDITEYRCINGEYVHDPLPAPEPVPSLEERVKALETGPAADEIWEQMAKAYQEGAESA